MLGRIFAHHPTDSVDNIRFSAAVRADYRGDAFMKIEDGFIGKRFEAE